MSRERRSKAVIILLALFSPTLLLNGCSVGMTYTKQTDSEGLVLVEGAADFIHPTSSDFPEPAASKIGQRIKSTATPEEWAAIQCLGGVTLDSVTLRNSCENCDWVEALMETFRSTLAHALEGTSSASQNCRAIRSLELRITFLRSRPPSVSAALLRWAIALSTCVPSFTLLCPGALDVIVKINAVAQPVQGVEMHAEGFGAATRVTTSFAYDNNKEPWVLVALAEALKALATDLKKQLDEQPQSGVSPLHSERRRI